MKLVHSTASALLAVSAVSLVVTGVGAYGAYQAALSTQNAVAPAAAYEQAAVQKILAALPSDERGAQAASLVRLQVEGAEILRQSLVSRDRSLVTRLLYQMVMWAVVAALAGLLLYEQRRRVESAA